MDKAEVLANLLDRRDMLKTVKVSILLNGSISTEDVSIHRLNEPGRVRYPRPTDRMVGFQKEQDPPIHAKFEEMVDLMDNELTDDQVRALFDQAVENMS